MVKFQKFYVTNGEKKARVWYHLDNRTDARQCVTLYARDYSRELGEIISDSYSNDTDIQTDYFDKGRVVLFSDHPLYAAARARAMENYAAREAKRAADEQARKAADAQVSLDAYMARQRNAMARGDRSGE